MLPKTIKGYPSEIIDAWDKLVAGVLNKPPSMKMYVKDIIASADIRNMKANEFQCYFFLLLYLWDNHGFLPFDFNYLKNLVPYKTNKTFKKCWDVIGKKFVIIGKAPDQQFIYNIRTLKEYLEAISKSVAAKASSDIHWLEGTASGSLTFAESPLADKKKFIAAFNAPGLQKFKAYDLNYYYDVMMKWGSKPGTNKQLPKSNDWLTVVTRMILRAATEKKPVLSIGTKPEGNKKIHRSKMEEALSDSDEIMKNIFDSVTKQNDARSR